MIRPVDRAPAVCVEMAIAVLFRRIWRANREEAEFPSGNRLLAKFVFRSGGYIRDDIARLFLMNCSERECAPTFCSR